ncbi:MAG: SPFH domain-containing protein, partial [Acutalibacteraceae bacterium]
TDPMLFYTNVCANISDTFERSEIDGMLKGELMNALQPALAKIAAKKIAYYEIPAHTEEIADELNEVLSSKWREKRGIEVFSFAVNSITIPEDQRKKITEWEENAMTRDPLTAASRLAGAQADAMRAAASNEAGAFTGFMGMGMAMNQGGMNAQNLYSMGQQMQQQQQPPAPAPAPAANSWKCSCGADVTGNFCPNCGSKKPQPKPAAGSWKCSCGATANGNFCPECGSPKPKQEEGWKCSCGAVNQGKFCPECGAKKPADAPLYRCDKCGWTPEDPHNPPKFCPECGDIFDENDTN